MTKNLYQLVQSAKKSEEDARQIIEIFKPKINKTLYQTSFNNREDVNQELKLKLLEVIKDYDLDKAVGFWEFRDLNRRHIKSS